MDCIDAKLLDQDKFSAKNENVWFQDAVKIGAIILHFPIIKQI